MLCMIVSVLLRGLFSQICGKVFNVRERPFPSSYEVYFLKLWEQMVQDKRQFEFPSSYEVYFLKYSYKGYKMALEEMFPSSYEVYFLKYYYYEGE